VTVNVLKMVTQARVLVAVPGVGFAEHPVRIWDVLISRARGDRLDRRLASGEPPEANLALAVRAQWLVRPAVRRGMAGALRRMLAVADARPPLLDAVPLQRRQVRGAAPELAALADRLERGGPVSAFGVARLRSLLTDGGGPLYRSARPSELAERVRAVRAALDVAGPAR
jgi:hypothetical protein